jgi:23S rRNA (uracil1939-C5)-methyltransferase
MQKNDVLILDVECFGAEAEGLCRHQGRVIFVPGALPGEKIQALIVKTLKSHAFGKLLSVLEPSPQRVEPPCPYYVKCGGCSCQHMSYEAELEFKRSYIQDALERIGGLDIQVPPVAGMTDPWHYRNKTSLPVALQNGIPVCGFYMRRSHQIIPTQACLIAKPQSDIACQAVTDWMRGNGILAYDEASHTGLIRHIMTRVSKQGEVMVVLVINGQEITHQQELQGMLRDRLPELVSLCVSPNTQCGNTIMGSSFRVLWGKDHLEDSLCGYGYHLSPLSFFQVNADQAEQLYLRALALAAPQPDDLVVDLYCGAGTISSLFASYCGEVIGIDR